MRARRTETSHHPIRLPGGNEDNDLWVRRELDGRGSALMASVWEPSGSERAEIATGANVELVVWGTVHPPVMVRTTLEQAKSNPQRLDAGPRIWVELAQATAEALLDLMRAAGRAELDIDPLAGLRVQLETNVAELRRQKARAQAEEGGR